MADYRVIGKATPRADGIGKVTGRAVYTADVDPPGTLCGKVLHSPHAHARILQIDTSEAKKLSGVHAVVIGADINPGLYGQVAVRDVPPIARDRVRFFGERIAAVAAEDEDIAQCAIDLIDVEYEELTPVFTPEEALADGAPVLHPDYASYRGAEPAEKANSFSYDPREKGDLAAGFAQADFVVGRTYLTQRVHQAYLETQAVLVAAEEQRVQVWACSKVPYALRDSLATAVGISIEDIVVNPTYIGGDFGGKGTPPDLPIAYYLSKASGRPVRIVPGYIQEFQAGNPRHSVEIRLKTGVQKDGTLTAHQVYFLVNCGAYAGFKPRGAIRGMTQAAGPYRIPNTLGESLHVYTNTIPGGHMRSPGEPQAMFAIESHIDEVANVIGMDPVALRLKNLVEDGDETAFGQKLVDIDAKETLQAATDAAGYTSPKQLLIGRGVAIGERAPGGGHGTTAITLKPDGTILLKTPIFDQGTGTHTTLSQVAAEELGIDPGDLRVEVWNTDGVNSDSGLGGSRGTRVNTAAAYQASQLVKQGLCRLALELLEWPEEKTTFGEGTVQRTDSGETMGWQDLVARSGSDLTGQAEIDDSERLQFSAFAAQIAEVEVDPETGQVKLLKFTTAHDVGQILNPVGHQGQINGGFVQGFGYALMKELEVEDGRVSTLSFGDYKIPTTRDIPALQTVLVQHEHGVGPYKVKGIGENSIGPVAPAIANAIADATGVRIRDLPFTAEKLFQRLQER